MISTKYSHRQFNTMFWQSVKKSCFFPIAAFVVLIIISFIEHIVVLNNGIESINVDEALQGIIWPFIINTFIGKIAILCFIIAAGVVNAVILYSFAFSKKQCNIIFSLGMTRKEIFISKFLAGAVPMFLSVLAAGIIELFNQSSFGYGIHKPAVLLMIYFVLCFAGVYLLSFTLAAAVCSNSGNILESAVFTGIIAVFPYVVPYFLQYNISSYTLGGVYEAPKWNLFNPYFYFYDFASNMEETSYLLKTSDFSGIIMDFALAAIIVIISAFAFSRRKNEITATWGKAKELNEICGGLAGFYCFTALNAYLNYIAKRGNGNILIFLACAAAFLIGYIIFRLIFGSKRKKVLFASLKHFPAYVAGLGIITVIFATGCFGYSSFIPDVSDVKSVAVYSQLWTYKSAGNGGGLFLGLKNSQSMYDIYDSEIGEISDFKTKAEIEAISNVHSELIKDGRIKNNASDTCGNCFSIIYTLNNGEKVERLYNKTTQKTAKDMIALSNLKTVKAELRNMLEYVNSNLKTTVNISGSETQEYYDISEDDPYNMGYGSMDLYTKDMYLFPTDMRKGYKAGKMTEELCNALMKDITAQNASDVFYHSSADEIGIIAFGVKNDTNDYYMMLNYSEDESGNIYDENGQYLFNTHDELKPDANGLYETSFAVGYSGIQPMVITKSMTNTVKYFEDNDLMKYFKSTTTENDVKSIRVATKKKIYKNKNSENLPLFYAAYSSAKNVAFYYDNVDWKKWGLQRYFDNIDKTITEKTTIKKVLDNAFVYGYCGDDYRIVEITYNDGAVATKCITADAYKEIFD